MAPKYWKKKRDKVPSTLIKKVAEFATFFISVVCNQERIAITGSRRAATAAGTMPAIRPITDETPKPRTIF